MVDSLCPTSFRVFMDPRRSLQEKGVDSHLSDDLVTQWGGVKHWWAWYEPEKMGIIPWLIVVNGG